MKKKIISIGIISLIIILSIIINDNVKDKTKIISYNGDSLMVSIDGENKGYLPNNGNYYLTDYECDNSNTKVSWDRTNYKLDVSNGTSEESVYCNLTFKSKPLLSEMAVGSYVAYKGKGGTVGSTKVSCSGNLCDGANANQDSDTSGYTYGYCYSSDYKYYTTGWRIAYTKDNKAILVSAGAPECTIKTVSEGNKTFKKIANALALKYCNTDYVDGSCTCTSSTSAQCDSASKDTWAINDYDFYYMTKAISGYGKRLAANSDSVNDSLGDTGGMLGSRLYCHDKKSYKECGYNNDLIDNGGYYWFASQYSDTSKYGLYWEAYRSIADSTYTGADNTVGIISKPYGLRPIISLSSSVYVTGGDGTMESPYTIDVDFSDKPLLTTAEVGSYVKYEGNNGCTGDYCSGANANSSSTSNGYCNNSNAEFNSSGWRIVYKEGNNAYLVSGGAPECMCTDSSGNASTSCASYTTTTSLATRHLTNLNTVAAKYCNPTYIDGGVCISGINVWAMDGVDFRKISGYDITDSACYGADATGACLDQYGLLDINGYYQFATISGTNNHYWFPGYKATIINQIYYSNGVRPVIKLASNIVIKSGTGTKTDPYIIVVSKNVNNNNDVSGPLLSTMEAGSYVEYVGNNGCTGDACRGVNANSSSTNNGYCVNSSDIFNSSGWRVAYTKDGSSHLISGGSPECLTNNTYSAGELDSLSANYCNSKYVNEGVCSVGTNVWAMDGNDFYEITGYQITDSSCFGAGATSNCNISNPNNLIANNSSYIFATNRGDNSLYILDHGIYLYGINLSYSSGFGFRPVIKLDPSIIVTGGTGTADDPYKIAKP